MQTLGIDLAARAKGTAACLITWATTSATVEFIEVGVTDDRLLELLPQADKVGIDVPLGWPNLFVEAVYAHRDFLPWPASSITELRYRATDRYVCQETKRTPLSVSTELIGVVALRAAALLSRITAHEQIDRMGSGRLVEVYPAAALIRWGFSLVERRNTSLLAARLTRKLGSRLMMTTKAEGACKTNRDALDSIVAAMIARASACGLCDPVPSEHSAAARTEGWIALPFPDSLNKLFSDG
jgi:predicted nuclease with RNAse H fold